MQSEKQQSKFQFKWQWNDKQNYITGYNAISQNNKIAAFDLDGTLIKTKSSNKFPINSDDWVYWCDSTVSKLQELHKNGYSIAILTNQKGIKVGKISREEMKSKIEAIVSGIELPVFIAISIDDDKYRKPSIGMWQLLLDFYGQIDQSASYYCGDAAGRKGDFTDSDLKFAINSNLEFRTPEQLFQGFKQDLIVNGFHPNALPKFETIFKNSDQLINFNEKQLIIFCGPPCSGKSTFWKNYMPKYFRIHNRTSKTKQGLLQETRKVMMEGESIIIDLANPKKDNRQAYITLGKEFGYSINCFLFLVDKELCFHNSKQIKTNSHHEHISEQAPKIVIHMWFKNYEEPQISEGFSEVKEVNFITNFDNENDEKNYCMF